MDAENTVMKAAKQAAKELAEETGMDEETVWKLMKKILFMYITRI